MVQFDGRDCIVAMVRDVSARKAAEAALRRGELLPSLQALPLVTERALRVELGLGNTPSRPTRRS